MDPKKKETVIVALHPLAYQGAKQFAAWDELVDALRNRLQRTAIELPGSTKLLLVFAFSHPRAALAHVFEAFADLKARFRRDDEQGPLPIQVIVHIRRRNGGGEAFLDPNAELWTLLVPEAPHITSALRYRWEALMADHELPPHRFEEVGSGLLRLVLLDGGTITMPKLFPHRNLTQRGRHPVCFYCGMTLHPPGGCPSRSLPPQALALPLLGYLPLAEIGERFRQAMATEDRQTARMKDGITPKILRDDPTLLAYVGYFDCFRVFQPRFLLLAAFTAGSRWQITGGDRLRIDNRSIHLGMDCLRVGNYGQAEEYFQKEYGKTSGKHTYALIGLALTALERGRAQDMVAYLDRARSMAQTEKERIYAGLLLGRYYLLVNPDYYKAKETADLVLKTQPDCADGRYLRILVEIQKRVEASTLEALQKLLREEPEFFLTAMLDPLLLPVEGFVEEMQHGQVTNLRTRASAALHDAKNACRELATWLDTNDKRLQEQCHVLAELEKKHNKLSYYDLLDVESRARGVSQACKRIVGEILAQRRKALKKAVARYERALSVWKQYPHKVFFRRCVALLHDSRSLLTEAQTALAQETSKGYRKAGELLDEANRLLDEFESQQVKMRWVQAAMESGRIFGLRLVGCEISVGLGCLAFFAVSRYLPLPAGLASLAKDETLQRQVTILAMVFLGPILATALTFLHLRSKA